MLTRFYADNFMCLVNFELTLDETNVLLGPNGSGKTSVLLALSSLQALVARGAKIEEVLPTKDLTQWQDRDEQRFELNLKIDQNNYQYALVVRHDRNRHHGDRHRMKIVEESLTHNDKPIFDFRDGNAQLYHDDYEEGPSYPFDWSRSGVGALNERHDNKKLTQFKHALANFIIASPCPPLFESETRSEDDFLDQHMKNFVGWYRHAAQENMGEIAELFKTLREALPGFDSINLTESGENSRILKVAFSRPEEELCFDRFGLHQLSDGQSMLVALYGLLFLSAGRRASLFLDEPDNYLSLREIQPWLAEVDQRCGDTLEQAVIVSHHPVTIDYMAGARGRWFRRDGTGPVRVSTEPEEKIEGLSLSETIARGWDR